MALNFENTFSEPDFLPSVDDLERYKTKLEIYESMDYKRHRPSPVDEYDERGRNITEHTRRQNKVPWIKVKYIKGKLYIPNDKKEILRSMGLF